MEIVYNEEQIRRIALKELRVKKFSESMILYVPVLIKNFGDVTEVVIPDLSFLKGKKIIAPK